MTHEYAYYERVASGGMPNIDTESMRVFLYPYRGYGYYINECSEGGVITTALENTFDRILEETDVRSYEILLWTAESGNYPDFQNLELDAEWSVDNFTFEQINILFKTWLKNEEPAIQNGATDLTDFRGNHHLIHGGMWSNSGDSCYYHGGSGGYAPSGAQGGSAGAYVSSELSWSPICFWNRGLTKGAAIQEVLHGFIDIELAEEWLGTNSSYWMEKSGPEDAQDSAHTHLDEHTLGNVYDNGSEITTTPMMEFHWDDTNYKVTPGDCDQDNQHKYYDENGNYIPVTSHDPNITQCTLNAVNASYNKHVAAYGR